MVPAVSKDELFIYEAHFGLLKKWNEKMGLVSRKSIDLAFAIHYADSLFISDFAARNSSNTPVYDLGTGAGFPGIIFAIRFPERRVTLFEKMLKKKSFLMACFSELNLKNVELEGGMSIERRFGIFLSRAVFPPDELFRFMRNRISAGSRLILNLGGSGGAPDVPDDFSVVDEAKYELPMGAGPRRIECLAFVPRETK